LDNNEMIISQQMAMNKEKTGGETRAENNLSPLFPAPRRFGQIHFRRFALANCRRSC